MNNIVFIDGHAASVNLEQLAATNLACQLAAMSRRASVLRLPAPDPAPFVPAAGGTVNRICKLNIEAGAGIKPDSLPTTCTYTSLTGLLFSLTLLICFVPALFFGKRAGKSTSEFFVSGRSVPWWLAGLSMVATTFSSDTPNLVTDIVRRQGVAGNWCWWAFALTGVTTVFFYARLWRRSGVMTDLEFYEIRYSGKAAGLVRGFRSVYLGLFFNCMIMASGQPRGLQDCGNPIWLAPLADLAVLRRAQRGLCGPLRACGACWSSI